MADAVVAPVAAPVAAPAPSTSGAISAPVVVAAPVAATTQDVNPGAWQAGFNDDLKGWVGNKGFKDAADIANAYRNLEKLNGVPQDRLMKLPEAFYDDKGALTPEGRGIYERLGAPKDAKDYGIEVPKEGGDAKLMERFTKVFQEAGVPKAAAQKIVAEWNGFNSESVASQKEAAAQEFRNQEQALTKEWGAAFDQNRRIAQDGMRKMGMDGVKVDALAAVLGHAETMKLLCNIGKATGEGTFVSGRPQNSPLEPASAQSRIRELTKDMSFGDKLRAGDSEALAMWTRLHEQASPGMMTL